MPAPKSTYKEKLKALREEIKAEKLDGFVIPRADEYQGEFVPACADRLNWLTGFTGSGGAAVVLNNKAVAMTDGRYTIQIRQQVDNDLYNFENIVKKSPAAWIAEHAKEGTSIGYDPRLHTPQQLEKMAAETGKRSIALKAVEENLIDRIWEDQPGPPMEEADIFPESIAGCSVADKHALVSEKIREEGTHCAVITLPDSIAWLLNVRGRDLEYIPVVLSYAIVDAQGAHIRWFVDPAKIPQEVRAYIGNGVEIVEPGKLGAHMDEIAKQAREKGLPVALDFARSPVWFKNRLEAAGATVKNVKDPCILPKSIKNEAEQNSIEETHIKDGVALARFLMWLDEDVSKGGLSELDIAEKILECRAMDPTFKGVSFGTIAGFGANGAIVHYRASEDSNARIEPPGLLLVDSGGQYEGGTTDITRTVAVGQPTDEMKTNFTLVLKGHIALAQARFPQGTVGAQVDALARQPLWNADLDYAHGTGHGVGCYLAVHEEAANISPRGQEPFQAGMLISNEPGYYKEGEYGIRTENLVLVQDAGERSDTGDKMLCFKTVSLAPIDTSLVVRDMLSEEELSWLNDYHARVLSTLGPLLSSEEKAWLQEKTKAL